jgi:hypothetical protein
VKVGEEGQRKRAMEGFGKRFIDHDHAAGLGFEMDITLRVDMLDVLQVGGCFVDLMGGRVVDRVIAFDKELEGGFIVAGEGKVLAHLVIVAFIGIDLPEFLFVAEAVIKGKEIVDIPLGSKGKDSEMGAVADGSGQLTVIFEALDGREQLLGVCGGCGQEPARQKEKLVKNAHQAAIIGQGLLGKL